jgi:hypothetical protein
MVATMTDIDVYLKLARLTTDERDRLLSILRRTARDYEFREDDDKPRLHFHDIQDESGDASAIRAKVLVTGLCKQLVIDPDIVCVSRTPPDR